MTASEILVIILAAALAIFLVLAIVLAILLIRVTRQVKDLTEKAKSAVENVERASSSARKLLSPAILLQVLKGKRRKHRDDD